MFRPSFAALVTLALLANASPASALEFSSSSTTGKGMLSVPLRIGPAYAGPIGLEAGLRVAPFASDGLGPANVNPGWKESLSALVDADADLLYKIQLADVNLLGRFNPSISPYVGYRYLGIATNESNLSLLNPLAAENAASYNQFGGLNYGVKAETELPLGFFAYAQAGMTTLLSGGWDTRHNGTSVTNAGKIAVGGTTLPTMAIGARWSLAGLIELSLGYELFQLPTGLRAQSATLAPGKTTLNTLSVGARILTIAI